MTRLYSVKVCVMTPLSFRNMASEYTLYFPSTHHRLSWLAAGARTPVGAPEVESRLSALADEANCAAVAGAESSVDPKASFDHETPKEPDASSSYVADPEGVPVSVCSSSYLEVVTTPDTTFLGVSLVARTTRSGMAVPGGTYSGSCSSSDA